KPLRQQHFGQQVTDRRRNCQCEAINQQSCETHWDCAFWKSRNPFEFFWMRTKSPGSGGMDSPPSESTRTNGESNEPRTKIKGYIRSCACQKFLPSSGGNGSFRNSVAVTKPIFPVRYRFFFSSSWTLFSRSRRTTMSLSCREGRDVTVICLKNLMFQQQL